MTKQEINFEEVFDKFAIRIITNSQNQMKNLIVGKYTQLSQIIINQILIG